MKISASKPQGEMQSPDLLTCDALYLLTYHILLWQIKCVKPDEKFVVLIKICVFKYISNFLEGYIIFIIAVKNFYRV